MLVINDGGRSESKRPQQQNDCVVRAIAIAANISYDDAYDMVSKLTGRKSSRSTPRGGTAKIGTSMGWPWYAFQAVKGSKRMTPVTTASALSEGRFILRMSKHVAAMVDGQVFDNFDCTRKCVYGVWRVG